MFILTGLVRKSIAPAFIARTLVGMSPLPVTKIIGAMRADGGCQLTLKFQTIEIWHGYIQNCTARQGCVVLFKKQPW